MNGRETNARFWVQVTGGTVTINPYVMTVARGTKVEWVINAGTGRVTFKSPGDFNFLSDTATPAAPASGTADTKGTHLPTIAVWDGELEPTWGASILIVE